MTYRAETSDDPDQSGPTTRREKLKAWWSHGEFEHPKKVAVACSFAVIFLLVPMTLGSAMVACGVVGLVSAAFVVIMAFAMVFLPLDFSDRGYARKMLLVSLAFFLVSFSLFQIFNPSLLAQRAAEEKDAAPVAEASCCSCPTDNGTC